MKLLLAVVAAAAASAFASLPAWAASSSSATLGPLTITLFDLNPADGIAAAITFNTGGNDHLSFAGTSTSDTHRGRYNTDGGYGNSLFDPVSSTSTVQTAWAMSSVSGSGMAAGTTLKASGGTLGTAGAVGNSARYSAEAFAPDAFYYYENNSFTLSTGTAVVISASSILRAEVTGVFDPAFTYDFEYARAVTNLSVSGMGASGSGLQSASDERSLSIESTSFADPGCDYGYCYGPASGSDSATMAVSFVNVSGADLSGNFSARAVVSGYSYAQAVPEPGTYAMLMAGLLAVAFMVRRRAG